MTQRDQKRLIIAGAAAIGLFVLYMIVDGLLLSPAARLDAAERNLRDQIGKLTRENQTESEYKARLRTLTGQMLDAGKGSNDLAAMVPRLAEAAKLGQPDCTRIGDRSVGTGFKEIGQSIRATGKLTDIVSFMYLLQVQSFVHRLDKLSLTRNQSGQYAMKVDYLALVEDHSKDKKPPVATGPTTQFAPVDDLDTPERKAYEVIATRDLLRPYIKRPPPPTPDPPPQVTRNDPPPSNNERPRPSIVLHGLPILDGQNVDIIVSVGGEFRHVKIGERLGRMEMVMADYRELPCPNNPMLTCSSRLILKNEEGYWAVDKGQQFTEKRRLKDEELPPELKNATSAPAASDKPQVDKPPA